MADQGADVIKIEPISGDITRRSRAPIDKGGEFSALFISSNRGKRSLAIDIKSKAGVEVLRKLVGQADVLVQNFRPGTMERLGLGPEELLAQQPRLIYVSISGVGERGLCQETGLRSDRAGPVGFADIQAQAGDQPAADDPHHRRRQDHCDRHRAGGPSALYAREKTGAAITSGSRCWMRCSSYLWPEGMSQYTVIDDDGEGAGSERPARPRVQDADGYITCGTISDSEWQGFCRATGDPALAADERFATPAERSVNATARIHKMQEYISQRTTAEWLARLDEADVPCAPILRRNEIISNEQVVARQIIEELDQPSVGRIRQPKPAARFETNAARIGGPAPRIGEHSRQILRDLGYEDVDIDEMIASKSVRAAE